MNHGGRGETKCSMGKNKLCFSFHLTNFRDITSLSATGLSELGIIYGVDIVRMLGVMCGVDVVRMLGVMCGVDVVRMLGVMCGVDVVRMLGVMCGVDVVRMFSKWSSEKNGALSVQLLPFLFQSQDICRSCTACFLCADFSKLSIDMQ